MLRLGEFTSLLLVFMALRAGWEFYTGLPLDNAAQAVFIALIALWRTCGK